MVTDRPFRSLRWLADATSRSLIRLGIAVLAMAPVAVYAQTEQRIAIEVRGSGTDMVGQRLVFAVKEQFRRSASFRITDKVNEQRLIVVLSTMDRLPDTPNTSTMYSVIWLMWRQQGFDGYLTDTIGFAGSSRVEESASAIVARTDAILSEMRKELGTDRRAP